MILVCFRIVFYTLNKLLEASFKSKPIIIKTFESKLQKFIQFIFLIVENLINRNI